MDEDLKEAFYEVDEILKMMPYEILDKIPKKFRNMISQNKSLTSNKKISGLNDENLSKDAKVVLYMIYRDFLCSEEEEQELLRQENKDLEEKYSYDNLFKSTKKDEIKSETISVEEITIEETALTETKELKWYEKIIDFIKNIFNVKNPS